MLFNWTPKKSHVCPRTNCQQLTAEDTTSVKQAVLSQSSRNVTFGRSFFENMLMEVQDDPGGKTSKMFHVHPDPWGKDSQLDGRIFFRMGWDPQLVFNFLATFFWYVGVQIKTNNKLSMQELGPTPCIKPLEYFETVWENTCSTTHLFTVWLVGSLERHHLYWRTQMPIPLKIEN